MKIDTTRGMWFERVNVNDLFIQLRNNRQPRTEDPHKRYKSMLYLSKYDRFIKHVRACLPKHGVLHSNTGEGIPGQTIVGMSAVSPIHPVPTN